jgi:hypothetical protein
MSPRAILEILAPPADAAQSDNRLSEGTGQDTFVSMDSETLPKRALGLDVGVSLPAFAVSKDRWDRLPVRDSWPNEF